MTDKIRVILFKEGDSWVAQGLEHDICVQASTVKDLYGRFDVAVRLETAEPGGLERIGEAPKHFFDLWNTKAGSVAPDWDTDDSPIEYGLAA
jgi:hypothetical protein